MNAPRLRAWNPELKMMIEAEEIFTPENIHMLLNTAGDYIWMRATGKIDKNANEIFEDDVVKGFVENEDGSKGEFIGEIYFKMGCFLLRERILTTFTELEILGNRHENSELSDY